MSLKNKYAREKKRRPKRIKDYSLTRHHVKPSSRGGGSELENIAMVPNIKHQDYHTLFKNKIPEEIVCTLVEDYWKGNWDYVRDAYNKYNNEKI